LDSSISEYEFVVTAIRFGKFAGVDFQFLENATLFSLLPLSELDTDISVSRESRSHVAVHFSGKYELMTLLSQLLADERFGCRLQEDVGVFHLDHAHFRIQFLPREPEVEVTIVPWLP
jgi:hypothetical protein